MRDGSRALGRMQPGIHRHPSYSSSITISDRSNHDLSILSSSRDKPAETVSEAFRPAPASCPAQRGGPAEGRERCRSLRCCGSSCGPLLPPPGCPGRGRSCRGSDCCCATRPARSGWNVVAPKGGGGGGGGAFCRPLVVRLLSLLLIFCLGSGTAPLASAAEDNRRQAPTPRITQDPQSAILAPHQDYLLRCGVTPDHAQVRWLFNGQPLNLSQHFGVRLQGWDLYFPPLTILPLPPTSSSSSLLSSSPSAPLAGAASSSSPPSPPAQEEGAAGGYDGEYRCTATTPVGTVISRPAVISRPVLRKFPRSDDISIQVEQGGYVTIPCTAPSSHPPANIGVVAPSGTLLLQGERVLALPSGSVVLKRLAVEDAGNYTCLAINPVSGLNHSATHHLRLSVIPSSLGSGQERTDIVDQSVSSLQVALGDTAYLECPVAGLGLPARIAWKRDYVELPARHTTTEFGQLIISSVELRDNGSYFCESPSGQKRQVQLQVFVPPKVTADVKGGDGDVILARVGEPTRLACKGQALPAASVTWYHDGQVRSRPAPSHGRELHVLTLDPVKAADGGVYVCELANRLGHAAAVLRLDVVRHAEGGEQGEAERGGAVSGREPEEVTEGGERDASRNFLLQVEGGKEKGGGERNKKKRKGRRKKGKKRLGGVSKVAGKSDNAQAPTLVPPSAPSVSRLTDSSVLVEWQVPDNDGEPISHFVVQYREVRPRKGEWKTHSDIISAGLRRHKVGRLKPGTTYMFRMFAVYANDDNRNGPSRRFHLKATGPHPERRPQVKPRIVEAKPIIYQNIYAINIKWQFFPTELSSVIGFNIYYRPYDSKEDFKKESLKGAVIRNHLLKDLQADTEYEIKMECFNSAGSSDYSNMVVKRTLPMEGQPPPGLPTPVAPPEEKRTEAPPGGRREAGGLEQPVILGIVLGVMLLLLVVFIAMCWWKQRQQKRRSGSPESCGKFQDQAQRIYVDSLRKKHPNGGPAYPVSGLNGLSPLPNGHGPPPPRGHPHPHLEVNPLAELDNLHHAPHRTQSPSLGSLPGPGGGGGVLGKGGPHHDHQLYPGKPYHMGNGLISNGTLPGYGHGHSSDNNFNSIRHTVSSDDMLTSTTGLLALPNGLALGSLQRSAPGVGDYPAGQYGGGPIPTLSRTSLSSFGHPRNHHHHHSHPHHHHPHPQLQPPSTRGRNSSLSHSDSLDSADEAGELCGERGKARYGRSGRTSPPPTPPLYNGKGVKAGGAYPPPAPVTFHPAGRCSLGRDNPGGPAPLSSFAEDDERRKARVPASGCYGHDGLCGGGGDAGGRGAPSAFLPPEGGGVYRPWAATVVGSGPAPTSGSRPKRRRKRPHSGREREREYTATKDQATNTDLSSNGEEGTSELGKSPAGSLSTGSNSSVSVTGHPASDVTHALTSPPPAGFHPTSGGDSDSGGSSSAGMPDGVGGGRAAAAARLSSSVSAAARSTSPPAATGLRACEDDVSAVGSDVLGQEVGSTLLLSADCGRLGRRKEESDDEEEEEGGPVEGRLMTRDCGLFRAAARPAISVGPL